MGILSHIKRIVVLFEKLNINYVLCGGIACILLGVDRVTLDIDFIVNIGNEADISSLAVSFRNLGYLLSEDEGLAAWREGGHWSIWIPDGYRLDIKFASSNLDYLSLKFRRRIIIDDFELWISSLEELIAAKLIVLASQKDLEDALRLMISYRREINWDKLSSYLGRDPVEYSKNLLDKIESEFRDEPVMLSKIRELKSLIRRLEE